MFQADRVPAAASRQAEGEDFADRMLDRLNGFSTVLMTSIGHQTGLFDTMASLPPSTSKSIARAARLNERYVREWLAAMTTSGVVAYDAASGCYALPKTHAASLTRTGGRVILGVWAAELVSLAQVEHAIISCFHHGGGVPYTSYLRLQQLIAEASAQVQDAVLLSGVLPLVPGLTERLQRGISVLDVGCGSGRAICLMADAFPGSQFTGYDVSDEAVTAAQSEAAAKGLTNISFRVLDVAAMTQVSCYDLITAFDAIHVQAHPSTVLRNIHAALRPGGTFLMAEPAISSRLERNLDHPLATTIYTMSLMHGMSVSLSQGGEGLGNAWGEELAMQMLADAGFSRVTTTRVDGDRFTTYFIASF